MNEMLAEAEFRRRVQAAANAYAVPQQQADELAMTIGQLPGWQQAPYVAAWTHATVLKAAGNWAVLSARTSPTSLRCCSPQTDFASPKRSDPTAPSPMTLRRWTGRVRQLQVQHRERRLLASRLPASQCHPGGLRTRRRTFGRHAANRRSRPMTPGSRTATADSACPTPHLPAGDAGAARHFDAGRRGISASLTAGFQGWQALPALGAESAAGRGAMAGLIALLPVTAAGWAFAPWRERRRWQRFIALGAAGLTLALDFAAWVVFASAEQLQYPWFAAALFTFVHAAGPLTLILFLQGWANRADESE